MTIPPLPPFPNHLYTVLGTPLLFDVFYRLSKVMKNAGRPKTNDNNRIKGLRTHFRHFELFFPVFRSFPGDDY